MTELAVLTSPAVQRSGVVVIPVGSLEQHGPHLPLHTDAAIATEVARRVVDLLQGTTNGRQVTLAPCVTYGASGEHQAFAGTLSIGTDVLASLLVELARSASTWAGTVVFINGHGGNLGAIRRARAVCQSEGRDARWAFCAVPGADLHAGETETSIMLAAHPDQVDMSQAAPGCTSSLDELLPQMRAGGVAAVSPSGVLGDPTGASAERGEKLLHAMTQRVFRDLGDLSTRARHSREGEQHD